MAVEEAYVQLTEISSASSVADPGDTEAKTEATRLVSRETVRTCLCGVQETEDWTVLLTINEAKLNKNYRRIAHTRMDPYCHVHIGNSVYKTPVSRNGARNPKWNISLLCTLPRGINGLYIEVIDERLLALDDIIAWGYYKFPSKLFSGREVTDEMKLYKEEETDRGTISITIKPFPKISLSLSYCCDTKQLTASAKTCAVKDVTLGSSKKNKDLYSNLQSSVQVTLPDGRKLQEESADITFDIQPQKIKDVTLSISVSAVDSAEVGKQKEDSTRELRKVTLSGKCSGDDFQHWKKMVADLKHGKCVECEL